MQRNSLVTLRVEKVREGLLVLWLRGRLLFDGG